MNEGYKLAQLSSVPKLASILLSISLLASFLSLSIAYTNMHAQEPLYI